MEWSRAMKLSVSSTRYKASATALHRLGFWLRRGATLLNGRQGLVGIVGTPRNDVFQASAGVVDQQQVNALPLQAVVVVEPVRIDQRHIALTVFGDDLFGTSFDLVGQLRKDRK